MPGGFVREMQDEAQFQSELASAGAKLVVVDFTASWCGPCQRIAPVYEQLSTKYPRAIFLKVDVDKCQETAASQGVSAMPTFFFFKNKTKVDRIQGADPTALENKVKQYYSADDEDETGIAGHGDLKVFIMKNQCECLNESDDNQFEKALSPDKNTYLESDCDAQLIISVAFNQAVKIHSIRFKGPASNGPKDVKIFINQPNTLDFDRAASSVAVQDLSLEPEDLEKGNPVNLRYVKFQNVQNIQLFIQNNQNDSDVTRLDYIQFIGLPICTTNMGDFKRVAGKKGESH